MENYINKLKRRNQLSIAGILGLSSSFILFNRYLPESLSVDEGIQGFIEGFQVSLICAFFALMVFNIIRINNALRDKEKLQQLKISEDDERNIKIKKEVSSTTSTVFLVLLIFATVLSGYVNHIIFFTLLAVLFVFVIIKAICKFYFRNKY